MAVISYDNATSATAGEVTSITYAHTCTGTSLILFVFVGQNATTTVTGITYNGVALTQVSTQTANSRRLDLWYLINPATGAHDVVASFSGTSANVRSTTVSYAGAFQSGQPDSSNGVNNASTTVSTTVVAGGCWLVGAFYDSLLTTITPSQTLRGTDHIYASLEDSNGIVGTGSQSLGVTGASAGALLGIVASFKPITPVVSSQALFFSQI